MAREYVGIDFHCRRSRVVRMSPRRKRLSVVRIDNSPSWLAEAVTAAGEHPRVVIEATYGWYWAVDVLQELGATVHLANPNALNWGERRVNNDEHPESRSHTSDCSVPGPRAASVAVARAAPTAGSTHVPASRRGLNHPGMVGGSCPCEGWSDATSWQVSRGAT